MSELLQQMDFWHWWVIAAAFGLLALLRRSRTWLWPMLLAGLVGYLVLLQPGMFWYRQWMYFLLPSLLLSWLGRSRGKDD